MKREISVAKDIEISGNIYDPSATKPIRTVNYQNVFGDDITNSDGTRVFPD